MVSASAQRFVMPDLSVIITTYNEEQNISACLDSLRRQRTDKTFEVLVIDSSHDRTATVVRERFPEDHLYHFAQRKYCGDARNIGIAKANADIIAFLDGDCVASDHWVQEILRAHRMPYPAIGGAIACGNRRSMVGWGAYFTEFSAWLPNTPAQHMVDVAGANMSYKKRTIEEWGPFIEGTYCSDTEFHWRLNRAGQKLLFTPEILISHHSPERLVEFLKHEYGHGKDFATVRIQTSGFSRVKKALDLAFSFLIPFRLFAKAAMKNVINRVYIRYFLAAIPLVFLGHVAWSMGEYTGYLRGKR